MPDHARKTADDVSVATTSSAADTGSDLDWASLKSSPAWLLVLYNNIFWAAAGFAIVLPSLWSYLKSLGSSQGFLALVIAMFSVGEGVGGLVAGRLYKKLPNRTKELLLVSMTLSFLGAALYIVAPLAGHTAGQGMILVARFLNGFDSGSRRTIEQSFISQVVPPSMLVTITSRLQGCAIAGVMLGPAFGACWTSMSFDVPVLGLTIDSRNAPGLMLLLFCATALAVTIMFFTPSQLKAAAPSAAAPGTACREAPPSRAGVLMCFLALMLAELETGAYETMTPVVAQELYGWGPCQDPSSCLAQPSQAYVNLLLVGGGLVCVMMLLLLSFYLGQKIHGHEVCVISLALAANVLQNLGKMDWLGSLPAWRFVTSTMIYAVIAPFVKGPAFAVLSHVVGPHPKASYMGMATFLMAAARVIGPLLCVELLALPPPEAGRDANFPGVYSGPVPRTWLLFGGIAVLNAAVLLLMLALRRRMRPHPALRSGSGDKKDPPKIPRACTPAPAH